jgi:glycosyltransferase involved in cell wall biosynthesis
MVLGVANLWGKHKGLADFVRLSADLPENYHIVLVGLNKVQQKNLPRNITGISRTESVQELAALYAAADVFVNPTYVDNFPTTNIEALACGTPVITYDTGGSPEAISETTGHIVRKGDIPGLMASVRLFCENGKNHYSAACRNRAEALYDKNERFNDYINLFRSLLQNK